MSKVLWRVLGIGVIGVVAAACYAHLLPLPMFDYLDEDWWHDTTA